MQRFIPFIFFLFQLSSGIQAQTSPTELDLDLELFITGASNPSDIAFYNDTMFVLDQDGIINMYVDGIELDDPFLNITSLVQFSGERGLLGMAFDPDFSTNRTFYLNYINNSGNTVIAAYKTYPDSLMGDPNSASILKSIDQPYSNHNGGQIRFGPDGYLYIGMGDGGSANDPGNRAQDPQELLGKMLRYDVNDSSYAIPPDNPFVGDDSTLDDIWALGLRNPWRFSFDRETGDLWIGDVGQGEYEEVDFQASTSSGGENYGWRCREGYHAFNMSGCLPASNYDDPVFEYNHVNNNCSITGGYVYRGADSDLLNGLYIGIDYCSGFLFAFRLNDAAADESYDFGDFGFGYTSFGEDDDGELYLARSNGNIYKVIDPCHSQIPQLSIAGDSLIVEEGQNYYWFVNGEEIQDWNQASIAIADTGSYYCLVENEYACIIQSNVVDILSLSIDEFGSHGLRIYPNPFVNSLRVGSLQDEVLQISILSIDGKRIWSKECQTNTDIAIPSSLKKGMYLITVEDGSRIISTQKMIKN